MTSPETLRRRPPVSIQFLELNPNPVFMLSRDGRVAYANARARGLFPTLTGIPSGHPILDGLEALMTQLMSDDAELVVFAREITYAGIVYDQQILAIPAEASIYLYMTDITDKKRAEHELRRAHAHLEERVRQRTAELARSNRDLEEFAYAASHDLRSPLRAIRNLAEWLLEDLRENVSAENRERLELLLGRAQRLDRLIDDLLQYSRAGRRTGKVRPVSTEELLDETIELLAAPAGFKVVKTSPLPAFETAVAPLQQVFRNLIGNAIKHHDREQGVIEVSARDAGECYEFSVRDDGPGIPPEFHERVFRLFETLKRRDDVEGSGMGLALVKRTIEALGGIVTLESDGQRGTRISFTWPKHFPTPKAPPVVDAV